MRKRENSQKSNSQIEIEEISKECQTKTHKSTSQTPTKLLWNHQVYESKEKHLTYALCGPLG